jgi:hypothetical protein
MRTSGSFGKNRANCSAHPRSIAVRVISDRPRLPLTCPACGALAVSSVEKHAGRRQERSVPLKEMHAESQKRNCVLGCRTCERQKAYGFPVVVGRAHRLTLKHTRLSFSCDTFQLL